MSQDNPTEIFRESPDIERKSFDKKWIESPENTAEFNDFNLIKTLGIGEYGHVMLVQHEDSKNYHAMKIMDKRKLQKFRNINDTLDEIRILHATHFPFILRLDYHFNDNSNVYIVLEFVPCGDLSGYLQRTGRFPEVQAKFYAAQVVLALEYLHHMDVIYRDLKSENLLIDMQGYVKLVDFGYSIRATGRTWTVCGTPEYMAPEIFLGKSYNSSVDWWALGVLIYELAAGFTVFGSDDIIKIYTKAVSGKVRTPGHFTADIKDLIKRLLQADLSLRYGNLQNGADDIKNHVWFTKVDWISLYHKKIKAPFIPCFKGPHDTENNTT